MAIQVSHVMKVIDLEAASLSDDFLEWFEMMEKPVYSDQGHLGEDLYPANELELDDFPLSIHSELKQIMEEASKHKAAYFRIVYE